MLVKKQVAPSRKDLRKCGPKRKLDMFHRALAHHKENGTLSLLYLELNVNYERIKHLLIIQALLHEL